MAERIEELTFDYRNEENVLVRREVDRAVLSKGAWATIMYLYQDLDRRAGTYKSAKVSIVRYRKNNGVYRKQSSFNISSEKQGRAIMEVLDRWYSTDLDELIAAIKPGQDVTEKARVEPTPLPGIEAQTSSELPSGDSVGVVSAPAPLAHEASPEAVPQQDDGRDSGASEQTASPESKADVDADKPPVSQPWKPGN